MTDNLTLWSSLEKTDPKYTKPFSHGFKGTAINGTYIIRRLTEAFGSCGRGWCFEIDEESFQDGHTLSNGDRARVHIIRGHISYKVEDTWYHTSPQFGQTTFVGENSRGVFTDEEAPKKSITDCISKCAVLLGIAADVHLGLFDDNKYVNDRMAEEAGKKAASIDPLISEKSKRVTRASINRLCAAIEECQDEDELDGLLLDQKTFIEFLKTETPKNYYGDPDSDIAGIAQQIEQRREDLKEKAFLDGKPAQEAPPVTKEDVATLHAAVSGCDSLDALAALEAENARLIARIRKEHPKAWAGTPGAKSPGLSQRIEEKRAELNALELERVNPLGAG